MSWISSCRPLHGGAGPARVLMTGDAVGGVWSYALELAAGFGRRGISTLLAVMGGPPTAGQRAAAAAIPHLEVVSGPYRLEWMEGGEDDFAAAGDWLLGLERAFAPDIVHLNGYAHAVLPWRAPVVVVAHSCVCTWWRAVHGEDPPPSWDAYASRVAAGLRAADLVVAPTAAFLEAIEEAYGPLAATRVVANGRIAHPRDGKAGADKEPIVLSVGRLWDEAKNMRALDAAAADLAWPVHVAGATAEPGGRTSRTYANLRCLGQLGDAEMNGWFERAAIFALPALYEPFGLVALEAAQRGCALVLGDIATLRELWAGAAAFVPPNNDRALHRAIAALAGDDELRRKAGAAAAARARRYGAERMVEATLRGYGEAAAHRRSGSVGALRGRAGLFGAARQEAGGLL